MDQARSTFRAGGGTNAVLIDLAPGLPRVMADRGRILQVLNNLIINAARHATESSPIRVAALRDGMCVAISVSDGGRVSRQSGSRTCSESTPATVDEGSEPASDSRSAGGWWRRTEGASTPRAAG